VTNYHVLVTEEQPSEGAAGPVPAKEPLEKTIEKTEPLTLGTEKRAYAKT
jgi:hypothetical protein